MRFTSTSVASSVTGVAIITTLTVQDVLASIRSDSHRRNRLDKNEKTIEPALANWVGPRVHKLDQEDSEALEKNNQLRSDSPRHHASSVGILATNLTFDATQSQRHRALSTACTFADGSAGTKCDGVDACLGVADLSVIGCGSCLG